MVNLTLMKEKAEIFVEEHEDDYYEKGQTALFWRDFLDIFDIKAKDVAQFEFNVKDVDNNSKFIDLFWKGNLVVEHKSKGKNLDSAFEQALGYTDLLSAEEKPNYIIVSDFERFRLINFLTKKKINFTINELPEHIQDFDFIYNYGKIQHHDQEELTLKASELLAKIHDELVSTNYNQHDLELFLMRILFCLYAEDTGIFNEYQFYDYIKITDNNDTTVENLGEKIQILFRILDQKESERQTNISEELKEFPYVNGSLFSQPIIPPVFTKKMYGYLLKACDFEWNTISPSIFGSLFQYIMDDEARRDFGAHYTSEENILKLINSLFMNNLWAEFNQAIKNRSKNDKLYHLEKLREKIGKLKFFDPACGSGNFLIVAYRELRLLEYQILEEIMGLESNLTEWKDKQTLLTPNSITNIKIDNFFGIEIDEFSSKIAQVSMWFIEHQMNLKYESLNLHADNLPLKQYVNIKNDNALRIDWNEIVEPSNDVYILGNPPFSGSRNQTKDQKEDMKLIFKGVKKAGLLDYVTAWFLKASQYIQNSEIKVGFVATNSIIQGIQVTTLWKLLMEDYNIHINFAHQYFKWNNEAKNKAAVYVVIIGFSLVENKIKSLYVYEDITKSPKLLKVKNINQYLEDKDTVFIEPRKEPLSDVSTIMKKGSKAYDYGYLTLKEDEKNILIEKYPTITKFIKEFINAQEFLRKTNRYCLWFSDALPSELDELPSEIKEKIENVKEKRLLSSDKGINNMAKTPYLFENNQPDNDFLAIPVVSSADRFYIPMDFLTKDKIVTNAIYTYESATLVDFGILTSRMHMIWLNYVSGKLKGDIRYSKDLVYNTFPFPKINEQQKKKIEEASQQILNIREKFKTETFVSLYGKNMPIELIKAHEKLDKIIETCYRTKKFNDDEERINHLLKEYKKLSNLNK